MERAFHRQMLMPRKPLLCSRNIDLDRGVPGNVVASNFFRDQMPPNNAPVGLGGLDRFHFKYWSKSANPANESYLLCE